MVCVWFAMWIWRGEYPYVWLGLCDHVGRRPLLPHHRHPNLSLRQYWALLPPLISQWPVHPTSSNLLPSGWGKSDWKKVELLPPEHQHLWCCPRNPNVYEYSMFKDTACAHGRKWHIWKDVCWLFESHSNWWHTLVNISRCMRKWCVWDFGVMGGVVLELWLQLKARSPIVELGLARVPLVRRLLRLFLACLIIESALVMANLLLVRYVPSKCKVRRMYTVLHRNSHACTIWWTRVHQTAQWHMASCTSWCTYVHNVYIEMYSDIHTHIQFDIHMYTTCISKCTRPNCSCTIVNVTLYSLVYKLYTCVYQTVYGYVCPYAARCPSCIQVYTKLYNRLYGIVHIKLYKVMQPHIQFGVLVHHSMCWHGDHYTYVQSVIYPQESNRDSASYLSTSISWRRHELLRIRRLLFLHTLPLQLQESHLCWNSHHI